MVLVVAIHIYFTSNFIYTDFAEILLVDVKLMLNRVPYVLRGYLPLFLSY